MSGPSPRSAAPAEPPPAAQVERFAAALARLNPAGGRIGLAVSGGPDSMALLLLAQAAIPGRFAVATVNHRLRAEAAAECALVARLCAALDVPCAVLEVAVQPGNTQREARRARYGALREWADGQGLSAVATAHHADDQAETLIMRLNRGSGVAGLSGVRASARIGGLTVIRPLLGFRRSELAEVTAGIAVARDPSNADDHYDRVRIRKALARAEWLDPLMLAGSAERLAEAHEALLYAADRVWAEAVTQAPDRIEIAGRYPRALAMRLVARAVEHFGGAARGKDLARLIDRLEAGEGGNVAGVLATAENGAWVFRPEPPRKTA